VNDLQSPTKIDPNLILVFVFVPSLFLIWIILKIVDDPILFFYEKER